MEKNSLGNNRFMSYLCFFVSVTALGCLFYVAFKYASPYAATWDEVDFALALSRYDLLAMQPHFPGYPYFILGGMMVNASISNPAKALSVFNAFLILSATIPVFLLVKRYYKNGVALFITAIIQSASYVMLIAAQPMSEGAALAVLWWYFWSVQLAKEHRTWLIHLLPLFFLSILLGIRLSYLPFSVAVLFLWYDDWKNYKSVRRLLTFLCAALVFQLIWVTAVALTEGSIKGFIKLALAFTRGHFNEWGGAVTVDDKSLFHRFAILIFDNIIWTGLSSQTVSLLALYVVLFAYIARKKTKVNAFPRWLFVTGIAYFLWALLAQNIDKPRHIAPLVAIILFYGWVRYFQSGTSVYKMLFALVALTLQVIVGSVNVHEQAIRLPATYQLTYDLQKKNESFVVYTWEETRVMQYLDAEFPHKRVLHFNIFLQDKANYKHAKIYLTDHVVKGFMAQGVSLDRHLRKVKTYKSSKLSDPVYGEITLYEWID